MHPFDTLDLFLDALKAHYHHLGRVDKARNDLHALCYKGDLVDYVTTFRSIYLVLKK